MSHTSPEHLRELHRHHPRRRGTHNRPIGILADLQGPKLRIGDFETNMSLLMQGQVFDLVSTDTPAPSSRSPCPTRKFSPPSSPAALLVNDGKIRLRIKERSKGMIRTTVEVGGELSARKGVNLPDTIVPVSAMTDKDRTDLEAACTVGVDWLALSFVQRPDDVAEAESWLTAAPR